MENLIKLIGDDCWDIILDYKTQLDITEKYDRVLKEMKERFLIDINDEWGTSITTYVDIYRQLTRIYGLHINPTFIHLSLLNNRYRKRNHLSLSIQSYYDYGEDDEYRSIYYK